MRLPLLRIVVALPLCLALAASAQVTVRKTAGDTVGVDLTGLQAAGNAAAAVRRTLELDLNRSGWMAVAAPGAGAVFVRGSISEAGGEVIFLCQVTDATGRTFINGTFRQPAARAIHLAHHVANEIVVQTTGKPTFFLAKLVLVGTSGRSKELYLSDSSGQEIRPLTQDRSIVLKPRWSPDNRYISFTSFLKRYPDVYTIELATGTRTRVSAYSGVNSGGAISPDGRSMALILSKDGNPDLYVKDLPSGRLTRLTNTPRADEGSPAWSPDGTRIVYVSNAPGTPHLYAISRQGGAPERLTQRGSQNAAPDWGRNGLIAYQTLVGGKFQIAILDPATRQDKIITPYDAAYEDPSWAPDGRHLVAARAVNYNYSVYLLDSMAPMVDKPVALTTTGDWTSPAWSH